jgi:diadenosine tetraphosphate (Ap4A) HIT family hydrolase
MSGTANGIVRKGVTYKSSDYSEIVDCVFCRIARRDPNEPATVVAESEKYMVFKTIKPVTSKHLLVVPKHHVQNVSVLTSKDVPMLQEMIQFGREALAEDGSEAYFCYHVPPVNSIDHLHLHAIGRPHEMSWSSSLKYCQYFPWCSSADVLIKSLSTDLK